MNSQFVDFKIKQETTSENASAGLTPDNLLGLRIEQDEEIISEYLASETLKFFECTSEDAKGVLGPYKGTYLEHAIEDEGANSNHRTVRYLADWYCEGELSGQIYYLVSYEFDANSQTWSRMPGIFRCDIDQDTEEKKLSTEYDLDWFLKDPEAWRSMQASISDKVTIDKKFMSNFGEKDYFFKLGDETHGPLNRKYGDYLVYDIHGDEGVTLVKNVVYTTQKILNGVNQGEIYCIAEYKYNIELKKWEIFNIQRFDKFDNEMGLLEYREKVEDNYEKVLLRYLKSGGQAKKRKPKLGKNDKVDIFINFPGEWFLLDVTVNLKFDNKKLPPQSIKKGFSIQQTAKTGKHTVEVKIPIRMAQKYQLDFPSPGTYQVNLSYNGMNGNFDSTCHVISDGSPGETNIVVWYNELEVQEWCRLIARGFVPIREYDDQYGLDGYAEAHSYASLVLAAHNKIIEQLESEPEPEIIGEMILMHFYVIKCQECNIKFQKNLTGTAKKGAEDIVNIIDEFDDQIRTVVKLIDPDNNMINKTSEEYADAQFHIAEKYLDAKVVEHDLSLMMKYLMRGVSLNHCKSLNLYGAIMHKTGKLDLAFENFSKAASLGDKDGMVCLASLYIDGEGVQQDFDKALRLLKAAADGSPEIQHQIGLLYLKESLPSANHVESCKEWLQKASYNGHEGAKILLETMEGR